MGLWLFRKFVVESENTFLRIVSVNLGIRGIFSGGTIGRGLEKTEENKVFIET